MRLKQVGVPAGQVFAGLPNDYDLIRSRKMWQMAGISLARLSV
jgi:hypothetical protein